MIETLAGAAIFICQPAIWDGDSLLCLDGPKVRLSGIAAREMDGTCKTGHPCPDAGPLAARDALVSLLGGEVRKLRTGHIVTQDQMKCIADGQDRYGRVNAWCYTMSGKDISCAMIEAGVALKWDRYWRNHQCYLKI